MGCVNVKGIKKGKGRKFPGLHDPRILASEIIFSVSEVEALAELFKTMSESIVPDGKISKEEFKLALFKNSQQENMLADRIFDVFDRKKKGKMYFEDFIRSLSVFHPDAPLNDKIDFSFRMYDLNNNGFIEPGEIRQMLTTYLVTETSDIIPDETVELIIKKTFMDADLNRDGLIDPDEWRAFVTQNPTVIKYMTILQLKQVTTIFPDFIWNTVVQEGEESSAAAEARVAQPRGSTSAAPNVQARGSTSASPAAKHGGSSSVATPATQHGDSSSTAAPIAQPRGSTSASPAAQLTTVKECESSATAEARVVKLRGSTSATPNVQPRGSTSAVPTAQHGGSRSAHASVAQPEGSNTAVAPVVQPEGVTSASPDAQPIGSTSSTPW
ncbi:calcineurin B protein [Trifolium repens]|nr:calcineurin B protein [Trifolium repens]